MGASSDRLLGRLTAKVPAFDVNPNILISIERFTRCRKTWTSFQSWGRHNNFTLVVRTMISDDFFPFFIQCNFLNKRSCVIFMLNPYFTDYRSIKVVHNWVARIIEIWNIDTSIAVGPCWFNSMNVWFTGIGIIVIHPYVHVQALALTLGHDTFNFVVIVVGNGAVHTCNFDNECILHTSWFFLGTCVQSVQRNTVRQEWRRFFATKVVSCQSQFETTFSVCIWYTISIWLSYHRNQIWW